MGPQPEPDRLITHRRIKVFCPGISLGDYRITSKTTAAYNCVAWALGITTHWWEPTPSGQYYWPSERDGDYSLESYVQMFENQGFSACESDALEDGFERIALYAAENGEFAHVALQSLSGEWSSKLGELEDIEHASLSSLEGDVYGSVREFMRRALSEPRLLFSITECSNCGALLLRLLEEDEAAG